MSVRQGHEVCVASLPECDHCKLIGMSLPNVAVYDAYVTKAGRWGYVCEEHFKLLECKTGIGLGQKLILSTKQF